MSNKTVEMMDERVNDILDYLGDIDPSSEEFEKAVKNMSVIQTAKNSEEKLELDNSKLDSEFDRWKVDSELKKKELENQEKSIGVRIKEIVWDGVKIVATTVGTFGVTFFTAYFYNKQTNKFLEYEKEGNIITSTVTSGHLRNIMNIIPKFGKRK